MRLPRLRLVGNQSRQQLCGIVDRRERVAQLVGEHRQELVLAPVGGAQLLRLLQGLLEQARTLFLELLLIRDIDQRTDEAAHRARARRAPAR